MAATKAREGGLIDAALEAAAVMRQQERPFAIVGGLAVAARAEPRLTRDVDLAVAVEGEREVIDAAEWLVVRGDQRLPIARTSHLIALNRPNDLPAAPVGGRHTSGP